MEFPRIERKRFTFRYGGARFDPRIAMMHLYGIVQGKKVVVLNTSPELCGKILAMSDAKGTFLESIFSTSAWSPLYSIESVDGDLWKQLSQEFKKVMGQTNWRSCIGLLTKKHLNAALTSLKTDSINVLDSELISRLVLRILFELLFEKEVSKDDEDLFFQASIEWRKEIAIKEKGDWQIKEKFVNRVFEHLTLSRFGDDLNHSNDDPTLWTSVFAQPFLISPQINVSDIFVSIFQYLKADPSLYQQAQTWASQEDKGRLGGLIQEAIRLQHPFPVLERELKDTISYQGKTYPSGTHFFILMDQLKQDLEFKPERWLENPAQNPYALLTFGAGPRMCTGKPIAMDLMLEMLKLILLEIPLIQIQPQQGHRFSGRNNDQVQSKEESRYQMQRFLAGLWKSFQIRRKGPSVVCPMRMLSRSTFDKLESKNLSKS